MTSKFGVLALALVCAIGCSKGDDSNAANTAVNRPPVVENANTPEANVPTDVNTPTPAANNEATNTASTNPGGLSVEPGVKEARETLRKQLEKNAQGVKPVNSAIADKGAKGITEAKSLAATVDNSMKALKNSKIQFSIGAILPEGQGDVKDLDTVIADQKRYLIRYAKFTTEKFPHFETYIVTKQKDGSYATLVENQYQKGRVAPDPDVLKGWVTDATHYIVDGVGTQKMPVSNLVAAAEKAKWKINVENQKYDMGTFKRIIMESPTTPKRRYEVLIHPQQKLMVSFNADIDDKKPTKVSVNLLMMKSDKPLTDKDLRPGKDIKDPIRTLTPDQARKQGIKVPGPGDTKENPNAKKKG